MVDGLPAVHRKAAGGRPQPRLKVGRAIAGTVRQDRRPRARGRPCVGRRHRIAVGRAQAAPPALNAGWASATEASGASLAETAIDDVVVKR